MPFTALYDRSPWSNTYDPPLPDGATPSQKLRELEVSANEAFDIYRDLFVSFNCPSALFSPFRSCMNSNPHSLFAIHSYFEGGVSSVYLWDTDNGFAGVVLIKKSTCVCVCASMPLFLPSMSFVS